MLTLEKDGFEHQSRQDELFARFEAHGRDTMQMLTAAANFRDLTTCEIEIMQSLGLLLGETQGPHFPVPEKATQPGNVS